MVYKVRTMYIMPLNLIGRSHKRSTYMDLWNNGVAFKNILGSEVLTINSIDKYRELYHRICIQYDTGIVEV